jgi:hypothetical protein
MSQPTSSAVVYPWDSAWTPSAPAPAADAYAPSPLGTSATSPASSAPSSAVVYPWDPKWAPPASAAPATQQNGPRAWGQASNLDDPYANASLADSAAAIGHTADNAVRNAVDGMTLGYGDKIAAGLDALTGRSPDYASALDAERAQSAQAMAQSPGGVGTAEQIAGMALPAGAIGRGAALIGDAAGALPFVGRLAASPLAQASATGAAVGGLNAAGNDQDVAPSAVLGALAGAGGNALARSIAPILAGPTATAAAPSTQALKATAQAGYDQADKAGVIVSPDALSRLSADVRSTLANGAYHPALQPKGQAIVDAINAFPAPGAAPNAGQPPIAGVTLRDLDNLRQQAGNMYDPLNDSSSRLGGLVKGNIDRFVNGLTPADTIAGDPRAAAAALNDARANWTIYNKANELDEATADARSRAARATIPNSNLDPQLRNAVARVAASRSDWTPDELAALNEAANGSPTQRALRVVGQYLNGFTGHALAGGAGFMAGGPVGASIGAMAPGIPGAIAKNLASRMTANAADRAGALIRSSGSAPFTLPSMGPRVASPLAALLIGSGVNAIQPAQPHAPGLAAALAQ